MAPASELMWTGQPLSFRHHHRSVVEVARRQFGRGSSGFWWHGAKPVAPTHDCFLFEECRVQLRWGEGAWEFDVGTSWVAKPPTSRRSRPILKSEDDGGFLFRFVGPSSCTVFLNRVSWKVQPSAAWPWEHLYPARPAFYPIYVLGIPSGLLSLRCFPLPSTLDPI